MEQHLGEFEWLKGKIAGVGSILEIGCRYGDSLKEMARVARPGAKIRAIDHGMPSGECPNPTAKELRAAIKELRAQGYDADVFIGDSHDQETLEWARAQGPFDFVYIDGDHNYEGVRQDLEDYGALAPRVGLHDINAPQLGPSRLWAEVSRSHPTQECIMSGMGVGIVILDQATVYDQAAPLPPQRSVGQPPPQPPAPPEPFSPQPATAAPVGVGGGPPGQAMDEVLKHLRAQGYNIQEPHDVQGSVR